MEVIIDFETLDRGLNKKIGIGPAWPIKLRNPHSNMFKVLGVSILEIVDGVLQEPRYLDTNVPATLVALQDVINRAEAVVMHNAQYDLGCLLVLGIDIKPITVYDTKILAKLYDNNLLNYSLDELAKKYVGDQKLKTSLSDVVRKNHLLGEDKEKLKTYDAMALRWAYENMDVIQNTDFQAMADYANQDTVVTGKLFNFYRTKLDKNLALKYCNQQKICVEMRRKGVRIDMNILRKGKELLKPRVDALHEEIRKDLGVIPGHEFNLDSPSQLGPALEQHGLNLGKTVTGRLCTDKATLKSLSSKSAIVKKILMYREQLKIYNDFFVKVEEMQQWTCPEALQGEPFGIIFPELNVLAASTGRFSSCNPNIQQIPKRAEEWTELVRGIYCADEGKEWHSIDWSNQEGRLQVHYASLVNAPNIKELVDAFHEDPNLDMHQKVADICGISRQNAKAINLGLSYGMGEGKLCDQLGLATVLKEVKMNGKKVQLVKAGPEAEVILTKYKTLMPYLDYLNKKCTDKIKNVGYIKTIGGRHLKREEGFDYKAMNKLIQGSAADQCMAVMQWCYDNNIDLRFVVHDELNLQGTKEDAIKVKHMMEHILDLKIPMVAELSSGESWGTIKKVK